MNMHKQTNKNMNEHGQTNKQNMNEHRQTNKQKNE